jgi:hypothetical protein
MGYYRILFRQIELYAYFCGNILFLYRYGSNVITLEQALGRTNAVKTAKEKP